MQNQKKYSISGLQLLFYCDLAHLHGLQGILMALGRYARAEGSGDADGKLREEGFHQKGVGDDADIRADADELCGFQTLRIMLLQIGRQFLTAKGQLVEDGSVPFLAQLFQLRGQLPAGSALDAVGNRKVLSFLREISRDGKVEETTRTTIVTIYWNVANT